MYQNQTYIICKAYGMVRIIDKLRYSRESILFFQYNTLHCRPITSNLAGYVGHARKVLCLEFQGTTSNGGRDIHQKALVLQVNCPPFLVKGNQTYDARKALEVKGKYFSVDKKNQLDVTFSILYFSSNSCSTCFGQPCAHHQELTTA